jgi:hypothetical protein
MPPIKVNKTAAYELNGQLFSNMPDAEIAVRTAVIRHLLNAECGSSFDLNDVSKIIAENWTSIKNKCDAAFAGI